jgi:hypothetical protein
LAVNGLVIPVAALIVIFVVTPLCTRGRTSVPTGVVAEGSAEIFALAILNF